jgi:hypothetical protein
VSEPPPRPTNTSREELGFERMPMVRWFDPRQLIQTAVRVAVSGLFGAYSDKREIQAALPGDAHVHRTYAQLDEVWFDYVADLGDGFAPTYTIAYLLSRPGLAVKERDGHDLTLTRGNFLVMGGDQVYPTASRLEYENRTLGPYRAAFPWTPDGTEPQLFAIPGNHDWYDGLTNFLRLFCTGQWIGAWRTRQNRSYFALELPHNWWLWGVDVQFDVYIDEPQIAFFQKVAGELRPGARVILVTGKPSWKHGTDGPNPSYDNVRFVEEKLIEPRGRMVVAIAGDDHHYARYEETASEGKQAPVEGKRRQKITSGGGGAALSATHHLTDPLHLKRLIPPPPDEAPERTYALAPTYPTKEESGWIPFRTPWRLVLRNLWFLPAVYAVYLLPAILLQPPVRRVLGDDDEAGTERLLEAVLTSKWILYAALILVPGLVLFAAGPWRWRVPLGLAHASVHLLLLSVMVAVAGNLLGERLARGLDLAVASGAALLAFLPGAFLVGVYLLVCDLFFGKKLARHAGEAFAAQRIEDRKNFLRLKIERNGDLVIYPIAVDRVAREGEIALNTTGTGGDPWLTFPDPEGRARLLEGPIRVR